MTRLTGWIDRDRAWPDGCWPNKVQQLLLQACLLEQDDAASDAFRQWEHLVPWDLIDDGSHRLLPLLHNRLRHLEITSKNQDRLAGVARYYWVRNQLMRRHAVEILQQFEAAQIPTLLLKGASLNATVYPFALRTMNDLDLVVRREDAKRAAELLNKAGASPQMDVSDEAIGVGHGTDFRLANGARVDLHWDFFHSRSLSSEQQQELWAASVPVQIGAAQGRVLCAADQLLHTCEHGVRYNSSPPFRWLADACRIIQASEGEFDWRRLSDQARQFDAELPVSRTLEWLGEHLNLPIPDEARPILERSTDSLVRRVEYRVTGQRGFGGKHTFWQTFPENVFAWRRQGRPYSLVKYHCLQHNINQNFAAQFIEFTMIGLLQTVSRLRSMIPTFGKVDHFAVGNVADDQIAGCYDVERFGFQIFRWTSRESALVVALPPGDYDVRVMLVPWRQWASDLEKDLRVDFNRSVVRVTSSGNSTRVVQFCIHRNMFGDMPQQRLTFRCSRFCDTPASDDRHLGVPLKAIQFRKRKEEVTLS